MKSTIDLSIIIPCYNEKENIPLVVKRFNEVKPKDFRFELILVDNGSTDGSDKVLEEYSRLYPFIRIVSIKNNVNFGGGTWAGLQEAKGEFLCWTHADMQTDIEDTIKAYRLIKEQTKKCYVKGNRYGRPLFDRFFTFGMSIFETLILKKRLYDINAQPNLFHKNFLDNIHNPPEDFSFELFFYYIAKEKEYKMIRFPVKFNPRIHGESKWDTSFKEKVKFIKRTLDFSFKLKKRLKTISS